MYLTRSTSNTSTFYIFVYSNTPHLSISSSSPPPSISPNGIKVKAEPLSPQRDPHGMRCHPSSLSITSIDVGNNLNILNNQHLIVNQRQNVPTHLSANSGESRDVATFDAHYLILYDLRFDLQEMLHQRIWATHLTPHNLCQITIHRLTCPTKDHAFPMDGPPSLVITTYFLNSSIVENNN